MSELSNEFKPLRFFLMSISITWIALWIGVIGNQYNWEISSWVFRIIAGISPMFSAIVIIVVSMKAELCRDYLSRLFDIKRLKSSTLPFLFLIISLTAAIAIAISLIYGLRNRFNLITSSFMFGIYWCLWHLPLFFLEGTYQYELRGDILGIIGFFLALIPVAIITQWLYYKNNRSILSAVLFHFMVNFIGVLMMMDESTKFIQALLMAALAAFIVSRDKKFFLEKNYVSEFKSLEFKID